MSSCESINFAGASRKELALTQLRKNLSDILAPDVTDKQLMKFLRAKNYSVRKTTELYRLDRRLKAIFKLEELDTWDPPGVLLKYEFCNHIGMAKDGTPIDYIAMGRGDLKGFVQSLDIYDIGRYSSKVIESDLRRCKEQTKKLGKEINEVTYIVDMEYFSLRQAFFPGVTELGFDLLRMLQDHYPEVWKNIFIVNAPFYFHTAFNFFKPIFKHTFLQTVHVVSRDRTASLLLKYIDPDVLPAFLGGKRVDSNGDPMCSEFMKFGDLIPEKYYLRNRAPLMSTDPCVEDVWLPPKTVHNACVVVREPNSKIRVELRTEGGSICCTMLFREMGSNPNYIDFPGKNEYLDPSNKRCKVIQCGPPVHFQTHVSPINNYCYAPWAGIYIFKFDNTFNWLTSRRCVYRFRAIAPGEDIDLDTETVNLNC